ncbi:hypothetical protein SAMN05428970_1993 [Agromyces sp. CF514]|uniref:hypothetical protein n=1 Tax=Agromyces sp. CF514 TaxID=1881031 RepID=UPI0008F11AD7|nr:hypothetical protein [Agromyces sp. CF514]SFR75941.1 hypothetical protein SAMN05428970_1993 [Agromyces sp. CF514]
MDISRTVEPRSDQLNFDDLAVASKTVTISEARPGTAEQPVELHLVEFPGRPYKPGKSMRRVLIQAWGAEASVYVGRTLELYGDPTIRFGKDAVGGIRIRALSHIDKPLTVNLTVTRGQRKPFVVQPLTVTPVRDWLAELELAGGDVTALEALGKAARTAGASETVVDKIRAGYQKAKDGA